MEKCPQCEEPLDDYQIDEGVCNHCGAELDAEMLGTGDEIIDADGFQMKSFDDED